MTTLQRVIPLALVTIACGSPSVSTPITVDDMRDAAVEGRAFDASPPVEIHAPAPPTAPVPVDFGACSANETEETVAGVRVCAPAVLAAARNTGCAAGEIRQWAHPACVSPATDCSEWPTPVDGAIYVREGGTGEGTLEAPLGSLSAALRNADSGTTIFVGAGEYRGPFIIPEGVTVRGACMGAVVFTAPIASLLGPVVSVDRGSLSNVTVRALGVVRHGIDVVSGHVSDVVVEDATGVGIRLTGDASSAANVVVRRVRYGASERTAAGIQLYNGSRHTIRDAIIQDVGEIGVHVLGTTGAILERIFMDGIHLEIPERRSACLALISGEAEVHQLACRNYVSIGVIAVNGATLTGERLWFEDGLPHPADMVLGGIASAASSHVEVEDLVIRPGEHTASGEGLAFGTRRYGLQSYQDGTLTVTDYVYEQLPTATPMATTGYAASATSRSSLELRRAAIVGSDESGLYANAESNLSARDVTIVGRQSGGCNTGVRTFESTLALDRFRISGVFGVGILAVNTTTTASDGQITDIRSCEDVPPGGFISIGGSSQTARMEVRDFPGLGVLFSGAEHSAEDWLVANMTKAAELPATGRGVTIEDEAEVDARRFRIAGFETTGMTIFSSHVAIADFFARGDRFVCTVEDCDRSDTHAAIVASESQVRLSGFSIGGSGCGAYFANSASADLADGLVDSNAIGTCLGEGTASFDIESFRRVVFGENIVTLQATEGLPLPRRFAEDLAGLLEPVDP